MTSNTTQQRPLVKGDPDIFPSRASQLLTHRNLSASAINFLQRVDVNAHVLPIHPVFLHQHPHDGTNITTSQDSSKSSPTQQDEPPSPVDKKEQLQNHLSKLQDEITQQGPTSYAIHGNSYSATIRYIYELQQDIVNRSLFRYSDHQYVFDSIAIWAYIRLAAQIFRIPFIIISYLVTWYCITRYLPLLHPMNIMNYFSMINLEAVMLNDNHTTTSLLLLTILSIIGKTLFTLTMVLIGCGFFFMGTYLLHFHLTRCEQFQRTIFGLAQNGDVLPGLYETDDNTPITTNVPEYNTAAPYQSRTNEHFIPASICEKILPKCLHSFFKGWGMNGDLETLIIGGFWDDMKTPGLTYLRRFVKNPIDFEWIALDIVFPTINSSSSSPSSPLDDICIQDDINNKNNNNTTNTHKIFTHNPDKNIIVIQHGLGGSSDSSYVRAMIQYYTEQGHTVIALNARTFNDTITLKPNLYTGGRISDYFTAITFAHIAAGNGIWGNLQYNGINHNQPDVIQNIAEFDPYWYVPQQQQQEEKQEQQQEQNVNKKENKPYYKNIKDYYENSPAWQHLGIYKQYPTLFSQLNTDLRFNPLYFNAKDIATIKFRQNVLKYTPVVCIGISMGGISLANYLTTMGQLTGLYSAVCICAISNMDTYNRQISEINWENMLYFKLQRHQLLRFEYASSFQPKEKYSQYLQQQYSNDNNNANCDNSNDTYNPAIPQLDSDKTKPTTINGNVVTKQTITKKSKNKNKTKNNTVSTNQQPLTFIDNYQIHKYGEVGLCSTLYPLYTYYGYCQEMNQFLDVPSDFEFTKKLSQFISPHEQLQQTAMNTRNKQNDNIYSEYYLKYVHQQQIQNIDYNVITYLLDTRHNVISKTNHIVNDDDPLLLLSCSSSSTVNNNHNNVTKTDNNTNINLVNSTTIKQLDISNYDVVSSTPATPPTVMTSIKNINNTMNSQDNSNNHLNDININNINTNITRKTNLDSFNYDGKDGLDDYHIDNDLTASYHHKYTTSLGNELTLLIERKSPVVTNHQNATPNPSIVVAEEEKVQTNKNTALNIVNNKKQHQKIIIQPPLHPMDTMNKHDVLHAPTMEQFDKTFTAKNLGYWLIRDLYLASAYGINKVKLARLATKTLIYHAQNDPCVTASAQSFGVYLLAQQHHEKHQNKCHKQQQSQIQKQTQKQIDISKWQQESQCQHIDSICDGEIKDNTNEDDNSCSNQQCSNIALSLSATATTTTSNIFIATSPTKHPVDYTNDACNCSNRQEHIDLAYETLLNETNQQQYNENKKYSKKQQYLPTIHSPTHHQQGQQPFHDKGFENDECVTTAVNIVANNNDNANGNNNNKDKTQDNIDMTLLLGFYDVTDDCDDGDDDDVEGYKYDNNEQQYGHNDNNTNINNNIFNDDTQILSTRRGCHKRSSVVCTKAISIMQRKKMNNQNNNNNNNQSCHNLTTKDLDDTSNCHYYTQQQQYPPKPFINENFNLQALQFNAHNNDNLQLSATQHALKTTSSASVIVQSNNLVHHRHNNNEQHQALPHIVTTYDQFNPNKEIQNLTIFISKYGGHLANFVTWDDNFKYIWNLTAIFHNRVSQFYKDRIDNEF